MYFLVHMVQEPDSFLPQFPVILLKPQSWTCKCLCPRMTWQQGNCVCVLTIEDARIEQPQLVEP